MKSPQENFQLGPNDRVETCSEMKMRTIPHVNNPPFRPGTATVGFLRTCGSLEKMYMNLHFENCKKKDGVRLDGHALLLQVCHRAPSVLEAATLKKKR